MRVLAVPIRMSNRIVVWYKVLTSIHGCDARTQLGLLLSAVLDTLSFLVNPSLALSPKIYISGIVCFKFQRSYVYFYVRGFSDDLYNVMPGREGDVNELILSCLKEDDVFLDVGANIGYYSVLAGKIIGDSGRVISVEPVPSTAEVLNYNIELNNLRNVKVIQKAIWSDNQVITMHVPKSFFGMASICNLHDADAFAVEGITLDTVCEAQEVNLLKIDAEGSEYQILKGARKTLEKTRNVVLEASSEKDKIIGLLSEEQFTIRKLKFTSHVLAYKRL